MRHDEEQHTGGRDRRRPAHAARQFRRRVARRADVGPGRPCRQGERDGGRPRSAARRPFHLLDHGADRPRQSVRRAGRVGERRPAGRDRFCLRHARLCFGPPGDPVRRAADRDGSFEDRGCGRVGGVQPCALCRVDGALGSSARAADARRHAGMGLSLPLQPGIYGRHGRERRRRVRLRPRGHGRMGRDEPGARDRGDRQRLPRPPDRSDRRAGRQGDALVRRRRGSAQGCDAGKAAAAQARLPQGRARHGRQRFGRQRWCGGDDPGQHRSGAEVRPEAARQGARHGQRRRRAAHHGLRSGAGGAQAVRAAEHRRE